MGLIKNIKKIMSDVEDLKLTLSPDTVYKAKKYNEISNLLLDIDLKVEKIVPFIDENGNKSLKIFYKTDPVLLQLNDESKDFIYNPKFYAINYLNLINISDMNKITKEIEEILNEYRNKD